MTEHRIQRELTRLWAHEGIPGRPTERMMLLGWELMFPSWKINDAHARWGQPAIDFLGVDQEGHLVIVELKVELPSRRSVLDAISQLTASALLCERSNKEEGLLTMLADLSAGANGRGIAVEAPATVPDVLRRHQRFFDLPAPLEHLSGGTRRVLAVRDPAPQTADRVANLQTPRTIEELDEFYANYTSGPMRSRLLRLLPIRTGELVGHITLVEV